MTSHHPTLQQNYLSPKQLGFKLAAHLKKLGNLKLDAKPGRNPNTSLYVIIS